MSRLSHMVLFLGVALVVGCVDAKSKPATDEKKPAAENNSGESIFKKTTQEIGKFDPNAANQVVDDQKIHATDPLSAPLSAYGPLVASAAISKVKGDVELFNADSGHYPTYEEFMEKIIKANNIRLPVLPYKGRYMFNEVTHELVVVRDIENAELSK